MSRFTNNRSVADFECAVCHEEYELHAQKGQFGLKVADRTDRTMLERLPASNNPTCC